MMMVTIVMVPTMIHTTVLLVITQNNYGLSNKNTDISSIQQGVRIRGVRWRY